LSLDNSELRWKLPEYLMEPWEAAFEQSQDYEKRDCVVPLGFESHLVMLLAAAVSSRMVSTRIQTMSDGLF
jgi:hypothetical protein